MKLEGVHHITAITGDAPRNLDFYTRVLGLDGGRRALALAVNGETRRRLEAAGVDVLVYEGDEISRKGDGGPTCLTLPLSPLA